MLSAGLADGGGDSGFFSEQAERPIVAARIRESIVDRYFRISSHSLPTVLFVFAVNASVASTLPINSWPDRKILFILCPPFFQLDEGSIAKHRLFWSQDGHWPKLGIGNSFN